MGHRPKKKRTGFYPRSVSFHTLISIPNAADCPFATSHQFRVPDAGVRIDDRAVLVIEALVERQVVAEHVAEAMALQIERAATFLDHLVFDLGGRAALILGQSGTTNP